MEKRNRIEITLTDKEMAWVREQCEQTNLTPGQLTKRRLLGQAVRPFAAEQGVVRQTILLRQFICGLGLQPTACEQLMREVDKLCRCLNF